MPEESDGAGFTVCASLRKVMPDAAHVRVIEDAVERVHRITIDATELLTLHITRCLEQNVALPVIDQNFVKMTMMEVSKGRGERKKVDAELEKTRTLFMPSLQPVDRQRIDQLLMTQSISIAASFCTNVWKHFPRRLFRYVRLAHTDRLTNLGLESKQRKLRCMQMAAAICHPTNECHGDDRVWVNEQRELLGCDAFTKTSVKANGKAHMNIMLKATWIINRAFEDAGERCASCCPTRRQFRPAFCNFDTKAVCILLGISLPKGKGSVASIQHDVWSGILSLDKSVIRGTRHKVFAGSFRTDGVSVRLLFGKPKRTYGKRKRDSEDARQPVQHMPTRGIYAIDQLKHLSRSFQLVGADPGKRELLVCVNADTLSSVRYTAAQRRCEMHTTHHAKTQLESTPEELKTNIANLADFNSRSSYVERQRAYFKRRREFLHSAIDHYKGKWHRRRLWERHIRGQRSLTDFVARLHTLQTDPNVPMVLAYGSWGGVAGTPGAPCNKGHPSCIGKGLRHKLSKHFVVLTTPEAYTSKTCSICGSICGPCKEIDDARRVTRLEKATTDKDKRRAARFSVRGLRHCHNDECAAHLNRDHNAAVNIQRRCERLVANGALAPLGDDVDQRLDALSGWMHHSD
jgi:hypothetical protein